jgi:hypothetical protein
MGVKRCQMFLLNSTRFCGHMDRSMTKSAKRHPQSLCKRDIYEKMPAQHAAIPAPSARDFYTFSLTTFRVVQPSPQKSKLNGVSYRKKFKFRLLFKNPEDRSVRNFPLDGRTDVRPDLLTKAKNSELFRLAAVN